MRLIAVFAFMLLSGFSSLGQTVTWDSVAPRTTDGNIETGSYNLRHYMVKSNVDTMQTLVVFLPGTYRQPNNYLLVMEQLALMGYHVIGLMYKTDPPAGGICRPTNDETCHWRARMETIDGVDRHPSISVNTANSVVNRLNKVLQWLVTNRPSGGWNQFYESGAVQWGKIIVSGHSQGASLSGIMGKEFPLKRVVMFSVMDYLDSGKIPSWVNNQENSERYYAFIHPKDELVPFTAAQIGWDYLGMTQYGAMSNADCNTAPYGGSHILYTTSEFSSTLIDKYHNATVLDIYMQSEAAYRTILNGAIRYLFKR